jgi:MFS family permease
MQSAYDRRLEQNLLRTLWLGFFQVFLVIMPIAVPFFQSKGLTMQEVFTLQAFFGLVVLITEVPSGYVADLFGRKRTLVIGAAIAGVGNSLLLVADGFWGLILFELCLGIAHSLISGADIAILYDSELALGRGEQAQRNIVGRLYGFRTTSESIAAVLCSLLVLHSMEAVVLVQAVAGWIPLILALKLVEPPGDRLSSDDHLGNFAEICRELLTRSRLLRLIVLALSIWSLTTFYAVWLLQKIWENHGIDLAHFGYLWAGLTVIAALSGRYAHWAEDRLGTTGLMLFIGLSPAVGYLGLEHFGLIGGYLASATFFVSRGFGLVVLRDALNRRIPSEYRATANSLTSFGFRGAFMITGPLVGYYLDLWGMQATLYLLAGATLVIFAVLVLPLTLAVRGLPSNAALERAERSAVDAAPSASESAAG